MNAPITVEQSGYRVTVTHDTIYSVRVSCLGQREPILNSFIGHDLPLVLGRALVLACGSEAGICRLGWDWHVGEVTDIGWLTLKGHRVSALPRYFMNGAYGYECGIALLWMGLTLELRRELKVAIAQMNASLLGKVG